MARKDNPIFYVNKPKRKGKNFFSRDPVLMVNTRTRAAQKKKNATAPWPILAVVSLVLLSVILWSAYMGVRFVGQQLFSQNDRFAVKEINAVAGSVLSQSQILEWAGLAVGDNLFSFNLRQVQKKLEKVALIKSAEVKRVLPDKVSIHVVERNAVARLGRASGGIQLLVDDEGYIVRKSFRAGQYPAIIGVNVSELTLGDYLGESAAADALGVIEICRKKPYCDLLTIESIAVGHPEYLDIRLDGGKTGSPTARRIRGVVCGKRQVLFR